MKRELLILISLLGLLHFPLSAFARLAGDVESSCHYTDSCSTPLLLHFRFDRSLVEYHYMDNPHTLREFQYLFSDSSQLSRIDTISITAYASPDGNAGYNSRLAHRRAVAVKGYLIWKYPGLDQHRIVIRSQGENWNGLRRLVEQDTAVPDREDVLAILNEVADKERCKQLLRRLNQGGSYRYIRKHLLPQLRNAAVCNIHLVMSTEMPPASQEVTAEVAAPTSDAQQQIEAPDEPPVSPVSPMVISEESTLLMADETKTDKAPRPLIALKTNLLSWAGLTSQGDIAAFRPNLSAELFFARRWSVMASAEYSYWSGGKGNKFWGLSGYSLEPRIWLWGDSSYRWLYVGAYGQAGDYDYRVQPQQNSQPIGASVTGTYWSTGLSLGVYIPLTPHWGVEAGVRGGYRKATGKAYDNEPPHAYYHHNSPSTHWGITGLNFSLTYRWLTK